MPNIISKQFTINGQPTTFFHPENDDTIYGTISCLANGKFCLDKVTFKPNDVFVDIGCNVGLVSLVIAKLFPGVRVLAFDASSLAIECLRRTIAANGLTNIESFNVAVGAEGKKDVMFYSNGKDSSCLVGEGFNSSNPVPELKVNQIAIDEIFDSYLLGIERVRYLKSDIEGYEHPIFARLFGERADILDRIDYLHLEVHPYSEYKPEDLIARVTARWGDRVFFDT